MRSFLFFLTICTTTLLGQSNFKKIPFGNAGTDHTVPQAPKKLIPFNSNDLLNQAPSTLRKLEWNSNMGTEKASVHALNGSNHSFWAEGSQKTNFNYRSANNSVFAFLNQFKSKLSIQDISKEFTYISREIDDMGMQHIRVSQQYQNIPVYGAELILHGKQEEISTVNGIVYASPKDLSLQASISIPQAEQIVIDDLKKQNAYGEVTDAYLKLAKKKRFTSELNIYFDENDKAHLIHLIHIVAHGLHSWTYKVDAHTGEILGKYTTTCSFLPHKHGSFISGDRNQSFTTNEILKHNNEMFFGKTTSSATDLGGKSLSLNTYQEGNTFYLVDASRQMFVTVGADNEEPVGVIWTFDGKNSSPAFQSFNPALVNAASNNSTWISRSAASAHFNAGVAYEYFLSKHQRNSINGRGGNILSIVNVIDEDGKQMDNAFWDGENMYYGNGAQAFTPLAKALDVAGHEMSHGVIQTSANLNYESESGALNESFADIFGRLIDRDDWNLGEDVVIKSVFPTGFLRSFIDPHNGGNQLGDPGYQPRTYAERYRGTEDNGGVHINSGIANWAFYQFVLRINNDLDKAEKIYYRALTRYLTRSSRFVDCRKAVIQAATDLHGASSAEVTAAKAAYDFVGIIDGAATTTQQDVVTNPGNNFIVFTDANGNGLYLADGNRTDIVKLSNKAVLSRPSVTDDGSWIVFVGKDKKIHYVLIDWTKGTFEESIGQNEAIWRNAVISRQGNLLSAIKDIQENKIHVFDYNTSKWQVYELYNPTFSTGNVKTGSVNYSDAMEFDHTGQLLMYDANNTVKNSAGADIEYWDISFLRVYNNPTKTFGDGKISKLFGQLPEKTSVGNPTFSKNSPHIIAFDYLEEGATANDTKYLCLGGNTETGVLDTIFFNSELSWPNYSNIDDRVIFNAQTNTGNKIIAQTLVTKSKIEGTGSASIFKAGFQSTVTTARYGVWFANGKRNISTAVDNALFTTYKMAIYPNPVINDQLNVSWQQPTTKSKNQFTIYDMMGKVHWAGTRSFTTGIQSWTIPLHQLAPAIYILKATIDGKEGSLKFVIER